MLRDLQVKPVIKLEPTGIERQTDQQKHIQKLIFRPTEFFINSFSFYRQKVGRTAFEALNNGNLPYQPLNFRCLFILNERKIFSLQIS